MPSEKPSLSTAQRAAVYLRNSQLDKCAAFAANGGTLDAHLTLVQYSLQFISSSMQKVELAKLSRVYLNLLQSSGVSINTVMKLAGKVLSVQQTLDAANRIGSLAELVSDVRIFNRLWGLLPLLQWYVSVIENPPTDKVIRYVRYLQVAANILYQPLENVAYLASHNVIPMSESAQLRLWCESCKLWAAHVVLEFVRLYREYVLYKESKRSEVSEKTSSRLYYDVPSRDWVLSMFMNAAYLPLTVHWSLPQGCLSPMQVGFFGTVAGISQVYPLWFK
ncbi:hypothetical protein CANCADRAFT_128550 [Tortispora caseinolytica NRRL Y-17796]|uniref:Uncharacterized protein n=1 Tax=Tortispora caseinolytica NRRL Y-17796 TaxID=767744 RepID=A0A1E4TAT6_9ASCO|nr:hypothetical protein CANCADRAFT_128550 [Tortispora caseinolytica NRRL Y-17796]